MEGTAKREGGWEGEREEGRENVDGVLTEGAREGGNQRFDYYRSENLVHWSSSTGLRLSNRSAT